MLDTRYAPSTSDQNRERSALTQLTRLAQRRPEAARLTELCRSEPYVDSLPLRGAALVAARKHLDALRAQWPEPADEQQFALEALWHQSA